MVILYLKLAVFSNDKLRKPVFSAIFLALARVAQLVERRAYNWQERVEKGLALFLERRTNYMVGI